MIETRTFAPNAQSLDIPAKLRLMKALIALSGKKVTNLTLKKYARRLLMPLCIIKAFYRAGCSMQDNSYVLLIKNSEEYEDICIGIGITNPPEYAKSVREFVVNADTYSVCL